MFGRNIKMKHNLIILFCVAVASGILSVVAWEYWQQPNSYEDCVFRRVTGTTSNDAARIIAVACRNQFPESSKYRPDNPFAPKSYGQ